MPLPSASCHTACSSQTVGVKSLLPGAWRPGGSFERMLLVIGAEPCPSQAEAALEESRKVQPPAGWKLGGQARKTKVACVLESK